MASSNFWRVAVPTQSRLLQIGKLTVIALAATPLLKVDEETVVPIPPISSIKSRQQEILQQQHKDTPIFVQIPRMPEGTTQVISAPGEQPRFGVERKRKTFSETALVLVCAGATVLALLYMIRSSSRGDSNALRKGAQYRILAQFATFLACLLGAGLLALKKSGKDKK